MIAKGNVRTIIEKVGELQNLIGAAKGLHDNDRSPNAHEKAQAKLIKAFDICLEITGMYDPVRCRK